MADATIIEQTNEWSHTPGEESVTLTVSDGETYQSKKFKTILYAQVSANADDDAALNVTFSGSTATINWAGVTDKALSLTLKGIQ